MTAGPLDPASTDGEQAGGRWYPTLVTLASGEVLAVSGHPGRADARHHNNTPEILDSAANANSHWYEMGPAGDDSLDPNHTYPRLHPLPDGSVFSVTPFDTTGRSCRYDPQAGGLTPVSPVPADPDDPPGAPVMARLYAGYRCSSVLLPMGRENGYRARVLVCNGEQPYIMISTIPTHSGNEPRHAP